MAGIAACDLVIMTWMIKNGVTGYMEDECRPVSNFFVVLLEVVASGIQDVLRRSSAWLSLLMAFVRFLAIKNALNSKFDYLSLPIFGVKVILGAVGLSALTTLFYWCRVRIVEVEPWKAPIKCEVGSTVLPNYIQMIVPMFFMDAAQALKVFNVIDGTLKVRRDIRALKKSKIEIVPTMIFPILTFLLVQNLRTARKSRQKVFIAKGASQEENGHKTDQTTKLVILMAITYMTAEGPLAIIYLIQGFATGPLELLQKIARKQDDVSKKDHTTKLVIMMTITFIAAEGPFGLVFFFQGLVIKPSGLSDMAADLLELFEFFVVINAVSHCFVCLFVSSPYRRAVKEMFCRNRKISVTGNKQVKSKASVASVSTVRRVAVKK
ncbi:unnamed protein product [Caenorhabditis brenneri]